MTDLDLFARDHARRATAERMLGRLEHRAPTAATQQVYWAGNGQPQVDHWNAETAVRRGFLASWVVARCCEIIANDIASHPFRVGDPDLGRWDATAPLAQMLGPGRGGPAPKLSARRLWWWTIVQRIVTGKFGWEIERASGAGRPVALWPLTAAYLRPVPSDGGSAWFSSFEYGRPDKPRTLTPDRVVYDWQPAPDDFRQPWSQLQSAAVDVSVSVMLGAHQYAFLKNGAVPATVVVVDQFPTKDAKLRWEAEWNAKYQGPANAGKTMVVEADGNPDVPLSEAIHIEQIGMSAKDARLIEAEQASLEHVAMALGVPWSRLSAAGRTYDNAGQEDETYWRDTVLPLATDLAEAVNQQLAPDLGDGAGWFDFSDVECLRDRRFDAVGAATLYTAGIITQNEARAPFGLPPAPEGDEFAEPAEPAATEDTPSDMGDQEMPDPADMADAMDAGEGGDMGRGRLGRGVPARRGSVDDPPVGGPQDRRVTEDPQARRQRIWKRNDATIRALEGQWGKGWRRMFARQQRSVLQALEGKRGAKWLAESTRSPAPQQDPSSLFNRAYWTDESASLAEDLMGSVATAAAARMSLGFGLTFDFEAPHVQTFITSRANQLAGQVTQTTYDQITRQLAEGVVNGESIPDLAARIRTVFADATANRATTIARTETISGFNGASQLFATEAGADVVAGQEWIATQDGRTREDHAIADGQVVNIGDPFDVGGEMLAYPGDPGGSPENTIQCRCTVAFLTPDDMAAASADRSVPVRAARAVLDLVRPGSDVDELAIRRALRELREAAA